MTRDIKSPLIYDNRPIISGSSIITTNTAIDFQSKDTYSYFELEILECAATLDSPPAYQISSRLKN